MTASQPRRAFDKRNRPVPAEPLGCAVSIFRAARVAAGDTVAIIGTGFLGVLLARLASETGARG